MLGSWGPARGRHSEQERRGSSGLPVLEPVRKGRQLTRGRGPGRRLLGTLVLTGAPCGVGGSGGRGRGCPRLQRALRSMLRLPLRRGRGLQGRPWAKRPRPWARWDLSGGPEGALAEAGKEEETVKACLPSSRVCFLGTSTRQSCFVFCFLVLFPGSIQNISLRCPQKDALVGTPDSPFPKPPRLVRHRRWTHTQPHTPPRPRASVTLVPVP